MDSWAPAERLTDPPLTPVSARIEELERWLVQRDRAPEALAEGLRGLAQVDPDVVEQRIADCVRELFGAWSAVLFRQDPESGDLVALAVSGDAAPMPARGLVLPRATGLAGLAGHERQPVATTDLLGDPRITLTPEVRAWCARASFRAVLSVPLVLQGRVVGVLGVGDQIGRVFADPEIRLARAFAAQAAVTLENARLYAEATRRRREAEELAWVARTLTESLDVTAVGERIVRSVQLLLRVRSAGLRLLRPDASLIAVASADPAGPHGTPGHVLPAGMGMSGRVIAEGGPVWCEDILKDPRILLPEDTLLRVARSGDHAFLAVPLRAKGKIIGALSISDRTGRLFTDSEVALLQVFADQAALALENARLYEEATRREHELAEKSALLQMTLENLSQGVSVFDRDLRLVAWNTRVLDELGFPREFGQVGKPMADFFRHNAVRGEYGPGDVEEQVAHRLALARRSEPHRFERMRPDGTVIEVRGNPLPGGGFVTTYTDMTERRRGEEALQKSEARYRAIVEDQTELICRFLPDGRLTFVNEAYCRYVGRMREELIGQSALSRLPGPPGKDRILSGDSLTATVETEVPLPSGEMRWQQWTTRSIFDADGRFLEYQSVGRDVSERRRAEEALEQSEAYLRQAQKMEAVGRLAGGVAHDFNNLLTVITGRSEILLQRLRADDPLRRHADLIQQTAFRAADLTHQLLAFSRKQMLQPKILDLNAVVAGMEGMLRRLIGEHIELVSQSEPTLGRVKADPGQIEQVIVNLVVNARDAMSQGGTLTIRTANVDLDEAFARARVGSRPGPSVMLSVADSGVGIDAETRAHLFEPFFTTKGPGRGTGLGLATVYGIVKQSDGYIWVESGLGHGSRFEIYLPRVDTPVEVSEPVLLRPGLPRGSETILLVEDQDEVRELAREVLEMSGYTVLEARNGRDATLLAEEYAGAIDLLLTDVVMPQISGRELADRLAPARPGMRVLYISGYTDDAIVHHGVLDPGTALLQKPFTSDVLAGRVREILDS